MVNKILIKELKKTTLRRVPLWPPGSLSALPVLWPFFGAALEVRFVGPTGFLPLWGGLPPWGRRLNGELSPPCWIHPKRLHKT